MRQQALQGMVALLGLLALMGCRSGMVGPATPVSEPAAAPAGGAVAEAPLLSEAPPARPDSRPPATTGVPTALPSPRPSATPTARPVPTGTATPTLRPLMTGGCCVSPVWRADSQALRFLDKPTLDMPVGLYEVGVNVAAPVAAGELVTTTLGNWEGNGRFFVSPAPGGATVRDEATGETWQVPSGDNRPTLSPDARWVAWQERDANDTVPFNERLTTIWVADRDGSEPRVILRTRGGAFSGWLPEHDLLFLLPDDNDPDARLLLRYRLDDGATTLLAQGERINGLSVSPDGQLLAYFVSLDEQGERNGFWLTNTTSRERTRLPFVGAYQWRDAGHLLVIPMEPGAASHRLQEYDVAVGTLRDLTDPAVTPFRVSNNDWSVSPDGSKVAFVSASDGNLWLLELGNERD